LNQAADGGDGVERLGEEELAVLGAAVDESGEELQRAEAIQLLDGVNGNRLQNKWS
jgi:hypothetical protein